MTLTPVTSSMLSHIGYDADTLTLYVRFNPNKKQKEAGVPGDLWAYAAVIPEKWEEMKAVEADPDASIGVWVRNNILGKYTGAVVLPEPETVEEDW